MSKFNVGDRVKVRKPDIPVDGCKWIPEMDCYDGEFVVVEATKTINKDRFLATNGFYFLYKWVEEAKDGAISPHYTTDLAGKDFLQRFFETKSPEAVHGAMTFLIGKYIDRLGKKDAPEKELAKVIDYATRYRDFLNK